MVALAADFGQVLVGNAVDRCGAASDEVDERVVDVHVAEPVQKSGPMLGLDGYRDGPRSGLSTGGDDRSTAGCAADPGRADGIAAAAVCRRPVVAGIWG